MLQFIHFITLFPVARKIVAGPIEGSTVHIP